MSEHFNHNDIFHTIAIFGVGILAAGLAPQLSAAVGSARERTLLTATLMAA